MVDTRIFTPGLAAFNADLRFFETGVSRSVQPILRKFANSFAGRVREKYAGRHATTHSVNAGGVTARATQRVAFLVLDGDRYPFLLGQEFGSDKYPQFPAWSGMMEGQFGGGSRGYFFFPTIREDLPDFTGDLADMVAEHAAKAFPEGTIARARRRR